MQLSSLTAVSPVDGRYAGKTQALRPIFSETDGQFADGVGGLIIRCIDDYLAGQRHSLELIRPSL
jgi:hypothetical protein